MSNDQWTVHHSDAQDWIKENLGRDMAMRDDLVQSLATLLAAPRTDNAKVSGQDALEWLDTHLRIAQKAPHTGGYVRGLDTAVSLVRDLLKSQNATRVDYPTFDEDESILIAAASAAADAARRLAIEACAKACEAVPLDPVQHPNDMRSLNAPRQWAPVFAKACRDVGAPRTAKAEGSDK